MKIELKIKVENVDVSVNRMVIVVDSVTDKFGNPYPEEYKRLFLYEKPKGVTDEISVMDAKLLGIGPVELFNQVDPVKIGSYNPTNWNDLPYAAPEEDPQDGVFDALIPADADPAFIDFVEDRKVTSSVIVRQGSATTLASFKDRIVEQVTALKMSFEQYSRISTLLDSGVYPEGWKEYIL